MVNEGILIPDEVAQVIVDGMEGILAGDTNSPAAQLLQLKTIALVESNGNTLKIDGGFVYRIDRRLSPIIIEATLKAGCQPVRYYEKELVNGVPTPTAHVIKVVVAVPHDKTNNPSDIEGMTWLDQANEAGMQQDDDNIYFIREPLLHQDVQMLRDSPVDERQ